LGDVTEMKRVAPDALVLLGTASTPFSGCSKAKAARDRAVADARGVSLPPWSVHDLRRTVATGLQRLQCTTRSDGSGAEPRQRQPRRHRQGLYQRHDWAAEKRATLDASSAHVLAVAEGLGAAGNVITLGRAS